MRFAGMRFAGVALAACPPVCGGTRGCGFPTDKAKCEAVEKHFAINPSGRTGCLGVLLAVLTVGAAVSLALG